MAPSPSGQRATTLVPVPVPTTTEFSTQIYIYLGSIFGTLLILAVIVFAIMYAVYFYKKKREKKRIETLIADTERRHRSWMSKPLVRIKDEDSVENPIYIVPLRPVVEPSVPINDYLECPIQKSPSTTTLETEFLEIVNYSRKPSKPTRFGFLPSLEPYEDIFHPEASWVRKPRKRDPDTDSDGYAIIRDDPVPPPPGSKSFSDEIFAICGQDAFSGSRWGYPEGNDIRAPRVRPPPPFTPTPLCAASVGADPLTGAAFYQRTPAEVILY